MYTHWVCRSFQIKLVEFNCHPYVYRTNAWQKVKLTKLFQGRNSLEHYYKKYYFKAFSGLNFALWGMKLKEKKFKMAKVYNVTQDWKTQPFFQINKNVFPWLLRVQILLCLLRFLNSHTPSKCIARSLFVHLIPDFCVKIDLKSQK